MRSLLTIVAMTIVLSGGVDVVPSEAEPGLLGRYYDDFTRPNGVITFDDGNLVLTRVDPVIDYWNAVDCYHRWQPVASGDWYGVSWTGSVRIDVEGDYAFGTVSDDGSQVWLDGDLIVDNGEEQWWDWEDSLEEGSYCGLYPEGHGRPDSLPGPLHLSTGYHAIEVRYYEARFYDGIELWWLRPGSGPSDIPYYGTNCGSGDLSINAATNWEIVPSGVLSDVVVTVPGEAAAGQVTLRPSSPNPFNPRTRLEYEVPGGGLARLSIHDLRGRLVATLLDARVTPGPHSVTWDGTDREGRSLPSGVYVARLEAGGTTVLGRMTLLR